MKKKEMELKMAKECGGYLVNMNQIGRFCNCGRDQVRVFVKDLDYIRAGQSKQYWVPDVVQKLWDLRMTPR